MHCFFEGPSKNYTKSIFDLQQENCCSFSTVYFDVPILPEESILLLQQIYFSRKLFFAKLNIFYCTTIRQDCCKDLVNLGEWCFAKYFYSYPFWFIPFKVLGSKRAWVIVENGMSSIDNFFKFTVLFLMRTFNMTLGSLEEMRRIKRLVTDNKSDNF